MVQNEDDTKANDNNNNSNNNDNNINNDNDDNTGTTSRNINLLDQIYKMYPWHEVTTCHANDL